MKQIALPISVHVDQTLESFEPGRNADVIEHLKLFATHPNRSPVPTYIWGPSGSGKTHLLRAVAAELRVLGQAFGWLDTGFATERAQSFDPSWEVILMDDVDQYGASQQQFAFNCFVNALTPSAGLQRWIFAAGALPPQDLRMREDLRTRMGWGHVFQLSPLSDEGAREVLKQRARDLGLALTLELEDYILSRFSRDLGHLTQLLHTLDAYCLQAKRAPTIPILKAMLDHSEDLGM